MRELDGKVWHAARGFLDHLAGEVRPPRFTLGELVGTGSWTGEALAIAGQPRPDGEVQGSILRPPAGQGAGAGIATAAGTVAGGGTVAGAEPWASGPNQVFWTRNVWQRPFLLEFDSIGEAAKALRSIQRNWAPCPFMLHRRTALIAEALPPLPVKPKAFPFRVPDAPMGTFTLLDSHTLLGSASCSSPFPNGEFEFVEDHEGPPSRAYRKLWEALVLAGRMPGRGDRCLDAGASPGGWTWALAGLGATVVAVDRAPLDPRVAAMPGVSTMKHDAFTLRPADIGPVDWLFSDVICYPPALFDWVSGWLESGLASNFICTIKMQGETWDRATASRFASIPGSRVLHLWHNRHELTWMRLG